MIRRYQSNGSTLCRKQPAQRQRPTDGSRTDRTHPNIAAGTSPITGPAADALIEVFGRRAERVTDDAPWADEVRAQVRHRLERWDHRRHTLATGRLGYKDADGVTGLLREPNEGGWDLWSTPMSLREVEPEVLLQLESRDPSLDTAPDWTYWPEPEQMAP